MEFEKRRGGSGLAKGLSYYSCSMLFWPQLLKKVLHAAFSHMAGGVGR